MQGNATLDHTSFVAAFGSRILGDDSGGISSSIFKKNVTVRKNNQLVTRSPNHGR